MAYPFLHFQHNTSGFFAEYPLIQIQPNFYKNRIPDHSMTDWSIDCPVTE